MPTASPKKHNAFYSALTYAEQSDVDSIECKALPLRNGSFHAEIREIW
jgi:hypothetical protein